MKTHLLCAWLTLLPLAVQAETKLPTKRDFAYGVNVVSMSGHSILEMPLPDDVYAGALNNNLSDLRVFDQSGGILPHEICHAPAVEPAPPRMAELQLFPLRAGERAQAARGAHIEITTASGTGVSITEPGTQQPAAEANAVSAYIVDLRQIDDPVVALRFNWSTADAASEAALRIEASEDLESWREVMQNVTLLRARAGGVELQRARIPIPEHRYQFLRFEPTGGAPLPLLQSVTAERLAVSEAPRPHWVAAQPQAADKTEKATAFWFDAARVAPLHTAQLQLPAANMALVVSLQSRASDETAWRSRWSGEIFALQMGDAQRNHTLVHFSPTNDRYWRVEVLRGAETLRGMQPSLQLGYQPARLRFIRQGDEPFLLAYGSARVAPDAPPGCGQLLGRLSKKEQQEMTGQAQIESSNALNNPSALKPLPKPTPVRQMVLWGVLIAGALLVLAMAATLMKKLRQDG